ncbi:glycosyltransferase family 22 protein [Aplosporella prunicola CBS 121167]|uniref:Mannosyltransferase n=1 Tax=Aplosporella prunicola CBS 121167 TaxID=1176127 RepID=A0A6A6BHX1_9PEZI|nr:glycosyltransferase family 22 protein [Aplosporella prunicola CBS 121167]KAF2143053.1 glycosyltransferase family 22 protein [Aplosporella prunicola CBS 121167]
MWRRTYLLLILARLYFALSASYLHPDENFQGPEVIAGRVFSYPVHLTWEFTTERPIRSSFPLWLHYGIPMYILRWIYEGFADNNVTPAVVYWTLRVLQFVVSFVLEDWAIQELVSSPRQRRVAVLLVASSYVTWTLQTHTFSNSLETIILAWSLVLIARIVENKKRSGLSASWVLGFIVVTGVFNRITFPAYLIVPAFQLLPHFRRKPLSLFAILLSGFLTTLLAVAFDTAFYHPDGLALSTFLSNPVITPLNNLVYNSSSANLAKHGLHPYWQHVVANLPQLLGPAYPLLFTNFRKTLRLASALSGVAILSLIPHQEARFLIPAVPLILSSIRLPKRFTRTWLGVWMVFNVALGILMGVYHQGGVVPVQMWMANHEANVGTVFWWKTYSPPVWLLNGRNEVLDTVDLMGAKPDKMMTQVLNSTKCEHEKLTRTGVGEHALTYLVAPKSATFLDRYKGIEGAVEGNAKVTLEKVWSYQSHLNLDDMDFGDDGVIPTLRRVIGRRGLGVWRVRRKCSFETVEGGNGERAVEED